MADMANISADDAALVQTEGQQLAAQGVEFQQSVDVVALGGIVPMRTPGQDKGREQQQIG